MIHPTGMRANTSRFSRILFSILARQNGPRPTFVSVSLFHRCLPLRLLAFSEAIFLLLIRLFLIDGPRTFTRVRIRCKSNLVQPLNTFDRSIPNFISSVWNNLFIPRFQFNLSLYGIYNIPSLRIILGLSKGNARSSAPRKNNGRAFASVSYRCRTLVFSLD